MLSSSCHTPVNISVTPLSTPVTSLTHPCHTPLTPPSSLQSRSFSSSITTPFLLSLSKPCHTAVKTLLHPLSTINTLQPYPSHNTGEKDMTKTFNCLPVNVIERDTDRLTLSLKINYFRTTTSLLSRCFQT